jgi:hypothetical protein
MCLSGFARGTAATMLATVVERLGFDITVSITSFLPFAMGLSFDSLTSKAIKRTEQLFVLSEPARKFRAPGAQIGILR